VTGPRAATPSSSGASSTPALAMLVAVAVIVVLRYWWHGRVLLYPLTLFATWVHEMGHGVTAILVGGSFDRLEIFADASGLARSRFPGGLSSALVSLGGLLAPPLVGCGILLLSRSARLARALLYVLIAAMLISLVIWVRTLVGVVLLVPLAGLLWIVARKLSHGAGLFVLQLLGFALALDTVSGLDYLFKESVVIDGVRRTSDIGNVANVLGGPTIVWSVIVAGFSLSLVALTGWVALRRAGRLVPTE
jgi:hypothetical protein